MDNVQQEQISVEQILLNIKARLLEDFSLTSDLLLSDEELKAKIALAIEHKIDLANIEKIIQLAKSANDVNQATTQPSEHSKLFCFKCVQRLVDFLQTDTVGYVDAPVVDLLYLNEKTIFSLHENGDLFCWSYNRRKHLWNKKKIGIGWHIPTEQIVNGQIQAFGPSCISVNFKDDANNIIHEVYPKPWKSDRGPSLTDDYKFFVVPVDKNFLLAGDEISSDELFAINLFELVLENGICYECYITGFDLTEAVDELLSMDSNIDCLVLSRWVAILRVNHCFYEVNLRFTDDQPAVTKIFSIEEHRYHRFTMTLVPSENPTIVINDLGEDGHLDDKCQSYLLKREFNGRWPYWQSSVLFANLEAEFKPSPDAESIVCLANFLLFASHQNLTLLSIDNLDTLSLRFHIPNIIGKISVSPSNKIVFATNNGSIKIGQLINIPCHCV